MAKEAASVGENEEDDRSSERTLSEEDNGEEDDRRESEEEEDTNREDNEDDNGSREYDEANKDGAGGGDDSSHTAGSGDEAAVMRPLSMYFQPTEYKKKIRISTRCYVNEFLSTLDNLEPPLTRAEKNWFERHPQFKHIFHLPKDNNHKLQGMWMLLLRTARIEKKKEV